MGMQRGRFITLEGGEGAGKSTQARRLVERLSALGITVVLTREPGGTPGAESLRGLLVAGGPDRWSPIAEALLMNAARSDHLERLIRPALARGDWVVCDRFADSTRAYQGAGGGVHPEFVEALERGVVGVDMPDLTLIFDLPAEVGLARATARDAEAQGRFEAKGLAFHEALRDEFLVIAEGESQRCALIDATTDIDAVAAQVWTAVSERLALA
jgi:dTMP kinase